MITILAIDADPGVRLTARRVLERAGFTVITAADQRSVLTCLASLKVDLVICDIDEARSSELALRGSGNWDPGMRMLVLSRKDPSSPAPVTCDDGLLGKPFTESELLTAVRRSLAQPASRSQRRRGATDALSRCRQTVTRRATAEGQRVGSPRARRRRKQKNPS